MDFRKCMTDLRSDGLSVSEIAEEIGVTDSAVREVIYGRTKAPRAAAALKLLALCAQRGIPVPAEAPSAIASAEVRHAS